MAPRTRSGKGLTRDEVVAHQQAIRAGPVNTTGLPALPTELLLEIVSHFPVIPIPLFRTKPYSAEYLARTQALRALSQMCMSLRRVFLPLVWQRIEVCASPMIIGNRYRRPIQRPPWVKELATELVQQLEIVTIRDPSLASYVKIFNALITSYSSTTILVEIARCLALFSNLHTIQILMASSQFSSISFRDRKRDGTIHSQAIQAFSGKTYPAVRKLAIPTFANVLLKCCPGVEVVTSFSGASPDIYRDAATFCPDIQHLSGYASVDYNYYMNGVLIQRMIKDFPKTRTFDLDLGNHSLTLSIVQQLAEFPDLQCIQICYNDHGLHHPVIAEAKKVLRAKYDLPGSRRYVILIKNQKRKRILIE